MAPLYEPLLAPKLQLAIMHLNADLIAGQRAAPDFDTYFAMRSADLQD
ncbi:hypothetical protein QCM77_44500 [Bradyrhizobium sp. SSUT18]|nr:hypothetical protein [Bradyrhizobium sp. SSUT18]MDH2406844.1 hypothetical protein [Bradyrhizobium sp. SSUT18]